MLDVCDSQAKAMQRSVAGWRQSVSALVLSRFDPKNQNPQNNHKKNGLGLIVELFSLKIEANAFSDSQRVL